MQEQKMADFKQALSTKADSGRGAIERIYFLEKWNMGDDLKKK